MGTFKIEFVDGLGQNGFVECDEENGVIKSVSDGLLFLLLSDEYQVDVEHLKNSGMGWHLKYKDQSLACHMTALYLDGSKVGGA